MVLIRLFLFLLTFFLPQHVSALENQAVTKAYLFDVDGVLTNPQTKHVEQPELFDEIIKRLEQGAWIGLNTGRNVEFMLQEVLGPLEDRIHDKGLLQHIFACGEKGGAWLIYDNGRYSVCIDSDIRVSSEIQAQVRKIVEQPLYSDLVFYDESKKTMIAIELKPGKSIAEFKKRRNSLENELQALLVHKDEYTIDSTIISFDIQHNLAGKDLGARKFVNWLQANGQNPQEYLTFGDSRSDYAMFSELKGLGKKATFIFVGERHLLNNKDCDEVVFPEEHFDKGTLSFLQNEFADG